MERDGTPLAASHNNRGDGGGCLAVDPRATTMIHSIQGYGDDEKHVSGLSLSASTYPLLPPDEVVVFRSMVCVVTPLFMAYAALVSFQAHIKEAIGIENDSSSDSYAFGVAVSLLFLAALIFRLCHNALLGWLKPRARVCGALCVMGSICAAVVLSCFVWGFKSLALIFVFYVCGGAAIGTFEANIVSCITPLGHATKKWALIGMPLGYNGLAIGGFGLLALDPSSRVLQASIFGAASVACFAACMWFVFRIPAVEFEASGVQSLRWLVSDCIVAHWREWIPVIRWNLVAIFADMFACILASTVALYVFHVDHVPLVPSAGVDASVPYDVFQCVFNICGFIGDFTARMIAYSPPRWWPPWALPTNGNPIRYVALTVAGLALCLCKVGVLAPIGMILIMFGNGMIYASTTRHIDNSVPKRYNLVAISVWLFIGDGGSYIASNLTTALSNAVGRVNNAIA